MLRRLKVRNFAVVEEANAEFSSGLNVITGETGAGKSVLMGALSFVLGGRTDASSVRDGAREAEVEAEFDEKTLRRTITTAGRSRAWIDDESVSIAELKDAAAALADINGPSAALRLSDESAQREALDGFVRAASGEKIFRAYSECWAAFSAACRALCEIESLGCADPDALELLRYQIEELESADLTEDDETLPDRHAAAAHAEEIAAASGEITEALGGDEGAAAVLAAARPKIASLTRHLPQAEEWLSDLEEATVRILELSRTISDAAAAASVGAEELAALDSRLTILNKLKRKYLRVGVEGGAVAALLAELAAKKDKLESFERRDEKLSEMRSAKDEAAKRVSDAGENLAKARRSAAKKLAASVVRELRSLGFLQADFSVELEKCEPAPHGCDTVSFVFAPNPGEAPRKLSSIASSGEMARIALALRAAAPSDGKVGREAHSPVLVFDEIDANIGGEVGKAVGERLRAVASGRQVVAITHLPQTAVCGDRHLVVSKAVSEGRTRARVDIVEGDSRISEIARMLGGEKITSVVRKHAKELLDMSR